jgi:hypothetical protein
MKDLDFDELDKAVNSLMTSVPKTSEPSKSEEVEKTLTITPTLSNADLMSFDKLDSVAASATSLAPPMDAQKKDVASNVAPAIPSPPAARRGGRFMDVVHPSSDMKKTVIPARPVSRQGATITPTTIPSRAEPQASSVPPDMAKAAMSGLDGDVQQPAPQTPVTGQINSPTNVWPDPLEVADFKDDTPPDEGEWSAPTSAVPSQEFSASEPSPLASPFLPDTKVAKRPLGTGSPLALEEELEQESANNNDEIKKTINDPNDQLLVQPGDIEPQLPEELQGDMMKVEADTHMGVPKTEQTHPSEEKLLESGLPPQSTSSSVTPVVPTGPTSIPQQYHEEPSTGDKENAGIYDTESYHQPLAHPAKKKSGWLWVLWIVIILLVGAGVGAALFFFGII